jgi:hypothetical protein
VKKILFVLILVSFILTACSSSSAADVASQNLSTAADNFQITRRIVFLNGITDKYLLVIEGFCSLGNFDTAKELSVTCKTGENSYKKHFLGLSDNVTYFSEQIESFNTDPWHYKIIFRPETIVPAIDIKISGDK